MSYHNHRDNKGRFTKLETAPADVETTMYDTNEIQTANTVELGASDKVPQWAQEPGDRCKLKETVETMQGNIIALANKYIELERQNAKLALLSAEMLRLILERTTPPSQE